MTKSKPVAPKRVKPEPVLAWCVVSKDGELRVASCCEDEDIASHWVANDGDQIIRVEIRPAPKRKSKRTKP